jgi:CRISPR-associated protein (TIGR03986 family)
MIKAAYNFVPVGQEERYYSPEWKNKISLDIPLSESAVSGKIKLNLTANTALFIKGDDGKFVNINNVEFIPGTSIKGCIRSVLEILSYGHLNEGRVQYKEGGKQILFPYRNIDDRNGYMTRMRNINCGWLVHENGTYSVIDWGKPEKIRYIEISRSFGIDHDLLKKAESIPAKYNLNSNIYLTGIFSEDIHAIPNRAPQDNRRFYKTESFGDEGIIVFSGYMTNKKSDFIFLCNRAGSTKPVSDAVFSDFEKLNPDYKDIPLYTGNNITNGIPVFFTHQNGIVETMGLPYLHRYYARTSVDEAIPQNVKGTEPDLSDLIFGSTELKGRIWFGHARKITGEQLGSDPIKAVLNSPKASYFPTYLKAWDTWDSNGATILGRKRFPIKPNYDISPFIPENKDGEINNDTISDLYPLKEDAKFEGEVHFHNLNPIELGALLSAITFHGNQKECKHSIGQAKALGYGSISIDICELFLNYQKVNELNVEIVRYLTFFEKEMDSFLRSEWKKSLPVKELIAMAKGIPDEKLLDLFTPMLLEKENWNGKIINEFANARLQYLKRRESLSSYSTILTQNITSQSPNSNKIEETEAVVSLVSKAIIQAKLIEGKDKNPKTLKVEGKTRPKQGDKVLVKVIRKGGNIDYLILKNIVK